MTTTTDTCWADPLTRAERTELARKLARHRHRFHDAAVMARLTPHGDTEAGRDYAFSLSAAAAEMSDLHLDVTERAEVPTS